MIHKTGSPIRSIISLVTTTIYQLTKTNDELITQYLSNYYTITSTQELIKNF